MTRALVGVDWGTSSLRVARLDDGGDVIEDRAFERGILTVPPGEFPSVLKQCCGDWIAGDALVLVCGMAGSRGAWLEAPYARCPAGFSDVASHLAWVEPGRVAIVPGLRCQARGTPDVMRGEETQVFGALRLLGLRDATLVLPGTHSKWVRVENQKITGFSTFMTGEFFALLRHHSILARTLPAEDDTLVEPAFVRGLKQAQASGSLLNGAFTARSRSLVGDITQADGLSYLSGLLIGEELRAQALSAVHGKVVIVGSTVLAERYALALRESGVDSIPLGSTATWHGLRAIAGTLEEKA